MQGLVGGAPVTSDSAASDSTASDSAASDSANHGADGVDGALDIRGAGEKDQEEAVRKRGRPRKNPSEKTASAAAAAKKSKPAAKRSKTPIAHVESSADDTDDAGGQTPRPSSSAVSRKLQFDDDPELVA